MPQAGDKITVPTAPGSRIETTPVTSSSGAISTETSVIEVTAPVVSGRIYRVTADFLYSLTVDTDLFDARIREDSVSGAQRRRITLAPGHAASFSPGRMEAEFTAATTENKTFHLTLDRQSGAGSITLQGFSSAPSYLYVDYIRDA